VGSTLYITLFKDAEKTEVLLVGETEFPLNELFGTSDLITVEEYQGVALVEVINKIFTGYSFFFLNLLGNAIINQ